MFLALHLQLCIFDSADRCEAVCIARQSPSGHTCAEGNSTVPSSSSIWHQLPVTHNLSSPSTFPSLGPHTPPPKPWHGLDRHTHFYSSPSFLWRDSQGKRELCANVRDHLLYYGMAPPQHSIKLFSVEIRPNLALSQAMAARTI